MFCGKLEIFIFQIFPLSRIPVFASASLAFLLLLIPVLRSASGASPLPVLLLPLPFHIGHLIDRLGFDVHCLVVAVVLNIL